MKFPQLAVGTRFRYQGKIYCKTSPMAASGDDGSNRMIPRSATVELLDSTAAEPAAPVPLPQAMAEYHALSRELLSQAAQGDPETLEPLLQRLDAAYAALLRSVA